MNFVNNVSCKVTSFLVVYNHAENLGAAFDSFTQQDFRNTKLIISDDGSTDNSVEILKAKIRSYNGDVELLTSDRNRGLINHLNFLRKYVEGKYVCFQGGDDIVSKDRISTCVEFAEKYSASLVLTNPIVIDSNGKLGGRFFKKFPTGSKSGFDFLTKNMPKFVELYPSEVFTQAPKIPTTLRNEDTILPFRAALNSQVVYLDSPVYFYRLNRDGHSIANKLLKRPFESFAIIRERHINYVANSKSILAELYQACDQKRTAFNDREISELKRYFNNKLKEQEILLKILETKRMSRRIAMLYNSAAITSRMTIASLSPTLFAFISVLNAAWRRRV